MKAYVKESVFLGSQCFPIKNWLKDELIIQNSCGMIGKICDAFKNTKIIKILQQSVNWCVYQEVLWRDS